MISPGLEAKTSKLDVDHDVCSDITPASVTVVASLSLITVNPTSEHGAVQFAYRNGQGQTGAGHVCAAIPFVMTRGHLSATTSTRVIGND